MKLKVLLHDVIARWPDEVRAQIKELLTDKVTMIERKPIEKSSKVEVDEAKRGGTVYASTRDVDLVGDIVTPDGWNLKMYGMNPKGLWSHNSQMLPVYMAESTEPDEYGLKQVIRFADTEMGEDCWKLFKGGFLRSFSAGFRSDVEKVQGEMGFNELLGRCKEKFVELKETATKVRRIITEKTLFETSLCNLPCNPFAMVQEVSKGKLELADETKVAIHFEDIVKKGVDDGILESGLENGKKIFTVKTTPIPVPPIIPVIKIADAVVKVIPHVVRVAPMMSKGQLESLIEKSVRNGIDKIRGRV